MNLGCFEKGAIIICVCLSNRFLLVYFIKDETRIFRVKLFIGLFWLLSEFIAAVDEGSINSLITNFL